MDYYIVTNVYCVRKLCKRSGPKEFTQHIFLLTDYTLLPYQLISAGVSTVGKQVAP